MFHLRRAGAHGWLSTAPTPVVIIVFVPSQDPDSDPSLPDPAALLALASTAARQVPGVGLTEREMRRVERVVLRRLKDRLDAVDDGGDRPLAAPAPGPEPQAPSTPATLLAGLLHDSVEQTGPQATARLYRWLLLQLVPDQARILAALSDGSAYPLVHVVRKGPMGAGGQRLLANASTVGRAAGVALPEQVPLYLAHLRALGLVDSGPEEESLRDDYDIAETEAVVRAALDRADGGARTSRRSLRMSALGHDLWSGCQAETADEI
jgi:Abortive infection alpha